MRPTQQDGCQEDVPFETAAGVHAHLLRGAGLTRTRRGAASGCKLSGPHGGADVNATFVIGPKEACYVRPSLGTTSPTIPIRRMTYFNVVIEIPRGSKVKYELDKPTGSDARRPGACIRRCFILATTAFCRGRTVRTATRLDVLVLGDEPVVPGAIMQARAIGVMKLQATRARATTKSSQCTSTTLAVCGYKRHQASCRTHKVVGNPVASSWTTRFSRTKPIEVEDHARRRKRPCESVIDVVCAVPSVRRIAFAAGDLSARPPDPARRTYRIGLTTWRRLQ